MSRQEASRPRIESTGSVSPMIQVKEKSSAKRPSKASAAALGVSLLDAVSEMEQGQEVAILQYSSGVMNVTNNFFENGITFFTNMIYTMIKFAVAGGDVAPFVGHNAVLRWEAVQKIAYEVTEANGNKYDKFWSEETVSEDFDMSLRLQSVGYIIRLASYKGDGFKEGVSLTVYDELARWEKYDLPVSIFLSKY